MNLRFTTTRGHQKNFDPIFGIFRVELGGLGMEIGKTSKFLKIELYMTIPTDQVKVLQKQNDAMKTDVKVASKTGLGFPR